MRRLYRYSEIMFSIFWIIIYVFGSSIADAASKNAGAEKSITFVFHVIITLVLYIWLRKNGLLKKYGLRRTNIRASRFLFYLPLIFISSINLWFGINLNVSYPKTVFYIGSMMCVGFLEELIFRGFLLKAMAKSNATLAIIVSSLTFGLGHIINLFNGSGADLVSNLCQVFSAIAFGFLFAVIFYRGKTLIPCIASHSIINALSAFSNDAVMTDIINMIVSAVICVVAVAYTLVLCKTLPVEKGKV